MVTFEDVLAARRRIAPLVRPTPVVASRWLSAEVGGDVLLKMECFQETGSFKIRGAANRLGALARLGRPVVAAGGGGLLAGVAVVAGALDPSCEVIGAQPCAAATLAACFEAGRQVDVVQGETMADGLSGNLEPGSMTVAIALAMVDRFVRV